MGVWFRVLSGLAAIGGMGPAWAADAGPPDPLVTYQDAVAMNTALLEAALPRFQACAHGNGVGALFKVNFTTGEATVLPLGEVDATCVQGVASRALRTATRLGNEMVFTLVLDAKQARIDGDVVLLGALGHDAIEKGVREHIDAAAACYVAQLAKDPTLEGEVTVSFTVLPNGAVIQPTVKASTLKNADAEKCLLTVVWRMRFSAPTAGGLARVSYPFVFDAKGASATP